MPCGPLHVLCLGRGKHESCILNTVEFNENRLEAPIQPVPEHENKGYSMEMKDSHINRSKEVLLVVITASQWNPLPQDITGQTE